jgi:hypothetical protein
MYRSLENEKPLLLEKPGLDRAYRKPTDNYVEPILPNSCLDPVEWNKEPQGEPGTEKRHATADHVTSQGAQQEATWAKLRVSSYLGMQQGQDTF